MLASLTHKRKGWPDNWGGGHQQEGDLQGLELSGLSLDIPASQLPRDKSMYWRDFTTMQKENGGQRVERVAEGGGRYYLVEGVGGMRKQPRIGLEPLGSLPCLGPGASGRQGEWRVAASYHLPAGCSYAMEPTSQSLLLSSNCLLRIPTPPD